MPIKVGGLTPFTLIDFPHHLAAVVFCQGCCWSCGYCHNPHLLPVKAKSTFDWQAVVGFLSKRQGFLDGVVFSGGEPLLQTGLLAALKTVRQLGYKTALHTGGGVPTRFQQVLPYLDWVGFDVKAPFADYAKITGVAKSGEKARQSLHHLLNSGVAHEIRTTVDARVLSSQDIARLRQDLAPLGLDTRINQI